jgi:hypothetical protein
VAACVAETLERYGAAFEIEPVDLRAEDGEKE